MDFFDASPSAKSDFCATDSTAEKAAEGADELDSRRLLAWLSDLGLIAAAAEECLATRRDALLREYAEARRAAMEALEAAERDVVDDPLSTQAELGFERETKAAIGLDLQRTALLRERKTIGEDALFAVLYTWAHGHRELGYRQGMNELVAFLALAAGRGLPRAAEQLVAAVTHALFAQLMRLKLRDCYQFRAADGARRAPLPLSRRIAVVHRRLLRVVDAELFRHLERLRFEPSVCLLRWIRLLFLRELAEEAALQLWDFLLRHVGYSCELAFGAETASVDAVDVVCVALLLQAREELLRKESEFAVIEALQAGRNEPFEPLRARCAAVMGKISRDPRRAEGAGQGVLGR